MNNNKDPEVVEGVEVEGQTKKGEVKPLLKAEEELDQSIILEGEETTTEEESVSEKGGATILENELDGKMIEEDMAISKRRVIEVEDEEPIEDPDFFEQKVRKLSVIGSSFITLSEQDIVD